MLAAFVQREISSRYISSLGGIGWVLVHPLILLGIYTVLFQGIFRVSFDELGSHPFVAFVALGLWPWLAFQEAVQRGSQAIRNNAAMVRKVAFAHELLVLAAVMASFLIHLAGFSLALVVLAVWGGGIAWSGMATAVPLLFLLFVFAIAVALVLSALQVFIPDIEQLLGPVFSVLFYATPILYPISRVPEWLAGAMSLNPLVHYIEPLRQSLLYGSGGSGASYWVCALAPLSLIPAVWFFRRLAPFFEDFV